MSNFGKSLLVLSIMAAFFGSLWAAMIFIGVEPDGFKDATIMLISCMVGAVGTKIGINLADKKKSKKSDKEL